MVCLYQMALRGKFLFIGMLVELKEDLNLKYPPFAQKIFSQARSAHDCGGPGAGVLKDIIP